MVEYLSIATDHLPASERGEDTQRVRSREDTGLAALFGFAAPPPYALVAPPCHGKLMTVILRSPFSQQKMRYRAKSRTVIYRSKIHPVLKRNFEVFSVLDWLAASTHLASFPFTFE